MEINTTEWRKCSSCKKPIAFNNAYYECSVSTCTGIRTGYVFCTLSCWEVHLPGAKHRNAGAIEKRSPTLQQYQTSLAAESSSSVTALQNKTQPTEAPRRIIVSSQALGGNNVGSAVSNVSRSSMANEVLVVVSKMKQHIRDLSDMNTSEDVNQILSDIVRRECEKAIERARADGRKTVMARDFK
ncbi:MAG: hypothetical protein WA160_15965 [Pseudobdellovibrio sp.]